MAKRNKTPANFFPLPLAPIEYYFLVESSPQYPMTFVLQWFFKGEVDRPAFEKAWLTVIERHPLLGALVDSAKAFRPSWIREKVFPLSIDWGAEDQAIEFPDGEFIDLTKEPGLRIWVRQGPERARVTLQIHHSCTDGDGTVQAMGDLFKAYAGYQKRNESISFAPLRPELMRHRARASLGPEGPCRKKRGFLEKLIFYKKTFFQSPDELASPHSGVGQNKMEAAYPRLASHTFSHSEMQALKKTAKNSGASLNDLLLKDFFLAIRQWNHQQGTKDPDRCLRVLMPISLRNEALRSLPATDLLSYGFVTFREGECVPNREFLEKVQREAGHFKNTTAGREFINKICLLYRVRKIPGLIGFIQHQKGFKVTAVLSNSGDITPLLSQEIPLGEGYVRAGNLVLEEFRGCPPLRAGTHAAIHIMTYAGRMTVTATCTPKLFSIEDTNRFLSLFISNLRESRETVVKEKVGD